MKPNIILVLALLLSLPSCAALNGLFSNPINKAAGPLHQQQVLAGNTLAEMADELASAVADPVKQMAIRMKIAAVKDSFNKSAAAMTEALAMPPAVSQEMVSSFNATIDNILNKYLASKAKPASAPVQ